MLVPLPPFAYAADAAAFEQRWLEEIPKRLYELQTEVIPERNILKYVHGRTWSLHNTQGKQVPGEFHMHEEVLNFDCAPQRNGELEKLTERAGEIARQMAGGMHQRIFKTVEEVTKETGNIFTWNKTTKNAPEVFREMLLKTEFGVTHDGQPSLPTFTNFDPAFLAEVSTYLEANPAYRDEVEAIKARKIAEALAREADRKAKFSRPA